MIGRFSVASLGLGVFCLAAFQIIGSTVDSSGLLHEAFALIPVGMVLLVIGGALGIAWFAKRHRRTAP
ncbi:DUF3955 domain-containing protein [Lysobacter sp. GCM10012299]|uniref:DUF3955 domain-containing protein n=1 Tax=Lysobacter sp. GCM10012299 TaxID=3317333 RepID=UPI0036198115